MSSTNLVGLIGRLGADPTSRTVGENTKAEFNLSVLSFRSEEKANWVRVNIWGKRADTALEYLKKGMLVSVSGRIQNDNWEKDGEKHSMTYVVADDFQMLGSKGEKPSSDSEPVAVVTKSPTPTKGKVRPKVDDFDLDGDDELPPF